MPDGAAGNDLVPEFGESDTAVLVLIHLLNDLGRFLFTDIEAARLNQALELLTSDGSVTVHVERVEGVIDVEVWLALEALPDRLSGGLAAEVLAEDRTELVAGIGKEHVIGAVHRVSVVRAAALHHVTVVWINSDKGV